jgi:hypothetical protein
MLLLSAYYFGHEMTTMSYYRTTFPWGMNTTSYHWWTHYTTYSKYLFHHLITLTFCVNIYYLSNIIFHIILQIYSDKPEIQFASSNKIILIWYERHCFVLRWFFGDFFNQVFNEKRVIVMPKSAGGRAGGRASTFGFRSITLVCFGLLRPNLVCR